MVDFLNRLRARLEAMQAELTPEAGFDRRAYGYDGEGADDATFGETDREEEEESPWRREADGPATSDSGFPAGRTGAAQGPETMHGSGAGPARPRGGGPGERPSRRGDPASAPLPSGPRPARSPAASFPDDGAGRYAPERMRDRRANRTRRLRTRLLRPESLRELFVLREVIDRPVALRPRPRRRPIS